MQRIIVTGATSMIGVALIEECIKHGTEVYAVVRESSQKRSHLPESSLIKFVDCSLEHLDRISPESPANPTTPYGAAKLASGYLAGMLCKELGI